ncbi:hypothetical protein LT493_00955 [Streptomyces tricolor]|nr:hypothetical protein [Streptomyces tricolor]
MSRSPASTRAAVPRSSSCTALAAPRSWDRWATVFDEAGFASLTPGWPDDPDTVAEAHAHPRGVRGQERGTGGGPLRGRHRPAGTQARRRRTLLRRADHPDARGPGLAAASVAIDPAPFRGVLPLPFSSPAGREAPSWATPRTTTVPYPSPTSSSGTPSPTR